MSAKEIIYPHFLHCCQETEDLYWKYIFEDLSYGRAPYGVYFTKGFMCCGFKGKEFSYRVDPNIPVPQLFKEVKTILKSKLGIQSSSDILSSREKFEKTSERLALNECNDWNLIKKKEVKSPIWLFDSKPTSNGIERLSAALAGSNIHQKQFNNINIPTKPANILAIMFFSCFYLIKMRLTNKKQRAGLFYFYS